MKSWESRWNELWDDLLTIIIIFSSSFVQFHFHGDDGFFYNSPSGSALHPIIIIIILDNHQIKHTPPYITYSCKSMDRLHLRYIFTFFFFLKKTKCTKIALRPLRFQFICKQRRMRQWTILNTEYLIHDPWRLWLLLFKVYFRAF